MNRTSRPLFIVVMALALAWGGPSWGQDQPAKKAVPSATAQAETQKLIRDLFKKDYVQRTRTGMQKLAIKLFEHAKATNDDSISRFVLFAEARDLAAKVADPVLALKNTDSIAAEYAINPLEMKVVTSEKVAEAALTEANQKTLAEASVALIDEAIASDQFGLARRFIVITEIASQKGKTTLVATTVRKQKEDVVLLSKVFDLAKDAPAKLETDPKNQEANLVWGKYQCFYKKRWEQGLHMLALGSDAKLKDLASKDLAEPSAAADQVEIGDGWWELAENENRISKAELQKRAGYWYQIALPNLTGLTKVRVEKRLGDVKPTEVSKVEKPIEKVKTTEVSKDDLTLMQGKWYTVFRLFPGGRELPANDARRDQILEVSGARFRLITRTPGAKPLDGTFLLKLDDIPKSFDFFGRGPLGFETELHGIYEVSKDTLRLSFRQSGKGANYTRVREFDGPNGGDYFVFKRWPVPLKQGTNAK